VESGKLGWGWEGGGDSRLELGEARGKGEKLQLGKDLEYFASFTRL
jgi:hypothetical protein